MEVKVIEIRDVGTFIPAVALRTTASNEGQRYLLRRAGWNVTPIPPESAGIILVRLSDGHGRADPYDWPNRTMRAAHIYCTEHWDRLADGSVVDVQVCIGETTVPKASERETWPCP